MTIQYPVNCTYDKNDGMLFLGFAETENEALSLLNDGVDGGEYVSAHIETTQAGSAFKTKDRAQEVWRDEIEAGYATVLPAYSGWIVEIETWRGEFVADDGR